MQRATCLVAILCSALLGCPTPQEPDAGRDDAHADAVDAIAADGPAHDVVVATDVTVDAACANADVDGDGHRSIACGGDDCDDNDPHRFPGNPEVCAVATVSSADGGTMLSRTVAAMGLDPTHDEDCDPTTFASATTHDGDNDGDGFVDHACANTDRSGMVNQGTDCEDLADQFGFAGTALMTRVPPADIHPSEPEVCNGVDDNCSGAIDEGVQLTFYRDCDGDMYGDAADPGMPACSAAQLALSAPLEVCMGHAPVMDHTDCGDTSVTVHPGATELCDAAMVDENCNGAHNEGCTCVVGTTTPCGSPLPGCSMGVETCAMSGATSRWGACSVTNAIINCWTDADGDGYAPAGAAMSTACACPPGTTSRAPTSGNTDCNDGTGLAHPGEAEVCDGIDNNCDSVVDNGATCGGGLVCASGGCRTCNPSSPTRNACGVCGGPLSGFSTGYEVCLTSFSWGACTSSGSQLGLSATPGQYPWTLYSGPWTVDGASNVVIQQTADVSQIHVAHVQLDYLPPGIYQVAFNHYDTEVLVTPSVTAYISGVGSASPFTASNSAGGWQTFVFVFSVSGCGTASIDFWSNPHFYAGNWSRGGDWLGLVTVRGPM